jgi:hypothetical protein
MGKSIDDKLKQACQPGHPFPGFGVRPEILEYIVFFHPELEKYYRGEIEQLRKRRRKRKKP